MTHGLSLWFRRHNEVVWLEARTTMSSKECVFTTQFPSRVAPTVCLLRRRLVLSREVISDVVRARGRVIMKYQKEDGRLTMEVSEFDNKKHGLTRRWFLNGNLAWEMPYIDGIQHGIERQWHTNGARRWVVPHVKGLMHGTARWWRDTGHCMVGEYIDGRMGRPFTRP